MRTSVMTALCLGLVLAWHAPLSAKGISQGAMLSQSCAACHGTDGKSPGAIPSLHGKSGQFIQQALTEYRSGMRPSTVMGRHARAYTDSEIQLIADYFAGLN